MKILHFSADNSNNGAGYAAARIHRGLLQREINSRFCAHFLTAPLEHAFTPAVSLARAVRLKATRTIDRQLARGAVKTNVPVLTSGLVGHDMGKIIAAEQPDVVQLHWICGGSFRLTSLAGNRVPIVWRLADMWAFCALDHYTDDATRYASAAAPAARSPFEKLVWSAKKRTYARLGALVVACPSKWMATEARRSELLGERPIVVVPTGCDTDEFRPRDRAQCRSVLDLPPDEPIILVGAADLSSLWKGADLAVDALAKVAANRPRGQPPRIVSFGFSPLESLRGTRLAQTHFGSVLDRRLMALLYNAADVFVAPSRMENLANTVLESLSCGTPVVAFDIGGMPDAIDHQRNGYLARPFDTGDLAHGIDWVLECPDPAQLRATARRKIVDGFSLAQEIDGYERIYKELAQKPIASASAGRLATTSLGLE